MKLQRLEHENIIIKQDVNLFFKSRYYITIALVYHLIYFIFL